MKRLHVLESNLDGERDPQFGPREKLLHYWIIPPEVHGVLASSILERRGCGEKAVANEAVISVGVEFCCRHFGLYTDMLQMRVTRTCVAGGPRLHGNPFKVVENLGDERV